MIRFLLIILFFSSFGWSVCQSGSWSFDMNASNAGFSDGPINGHWCCKTNCSTYYCPNQQLCSSGSWCQIGTFYNYDSFSGYGGYYTNCDGCKTQQQNSSCGSGSSLANNGSVVKYCFNRCSTQEEADSLQCVLNPSGPGCEDKCDTYRSQCDQLGGVFTGHQTQTGCAASCNTCGNRANTNIMDIKAASCCSQGLAPSVDKMCWTPDIASGDGMQVSTNANLDCVDPNIDEENLNLYVTYCYEQDVSSSSVESSADAASSGGGGSSGEDVNSSAGGVPGEQIDYYPILDTIRDTLINIKRNVNTITTCLITPGACAGLNPQVNVVVPSDSAYIKNVNNSINIQTDLIDSSLRNGNERIRNAIANANDTLIDSLRKFMSSSYGDTLHNVHNSIIDIASNVSFKLGYGDTASSSLRQDLGGLKLSIDRIGDMLEGSQVDTSGLGVWGTYLENGVILGDSIVSSYGWHNLNEINVDSNYSAALAGINFKTDSIVSVVDDSLSDLAGRLNDSLIRKNDSLKRGLPDTLTKYADSLIIWAPFADFDSIIYSTIGTRIPNRDDCPEDCQSWSVSIPVIGLVNYTVDYGLCLGRASLGNLSVLAFLKLLIRIIVAITCVMIIYRTLVAIK